jgi:hypothetical protein
MLDENDWDAEDAHYYVLSRSLYRVVVARAERMALCDSEKARILAACEYAIGRLSDNPASAPVVSRWLCREIRWVYAREDQLSLCQAISISLNLAADVVTEAKLAQPPACAAFTRHGEQCQRRARSGSEYCPTHRHLDPEFEIEPAVSLMG